MEMRILAILIALMVIPSAAAQPLLLVGNKSEDSVSFIDLASGKERQRVTTGKMPHEIAISPDGKQAAVVAYGSTTIDIFDVATAKLAKRIDLSPNARPHGIIWLADGRIIATTEGSDSLTLVSSDFKNVEGIATGQKASHMVAANPDGRLAYVANIGSGTVSVIDLGKKQKVSDIVVGGKPEGLALSPDGRWLWVGDLDAPVVRLVDTTTGKVVSELPVEPVAIRVAYSPDGKWVVTSNVVSGSLTVIDAEKRTVARTIKVSGDPQAGQVTILFSADGKHLYAAETGRNQVAEIDFAKGTVIRRLEAGKNGDGLAIAS
jgi:YVTN family beta-propeller protein